MTIQMTLQYEGDNLAIIVEGNNFMVMDDSGTVTTIEGLKLDYNGVMKEHPDLVDDPDWNKKAKERFKEYLKKFKTEMDKIKYSKDELTKWGYKALFYQKAGFRPSKFK